MAQRVLVPVDGSEESEQALEYVLDELPETEVTLLHVLAPSSTFGYDDEDYFDIEEYQQQTQRQREHGERILESCRETAAARGVDVETMLATGRPARQILETVESEGVDHVVMGSRGRSGIGRVLFGSVAETVTRRASVPVTVVR